MLTIKKHILFLTTFLLTLTIGHGQTNVYHPFPDTNAVWRVNSGQGCPVNYINYANSSYQYTMGGDTIIGLYTYKKIYQSGMLSSCPNYTLSTYSYSFIGGLRQDTANKKVYFKYKYSSCPDTLLYDFSKQVGDTLNMISCTFGFTVTITSIDSVLVGSNYHKQFHFQSNTYGIINTIIEGVGATSGLLEPIYSEPGWHWNLVCFSHNLELYPSTSASCALITGTQELLHADHQIKIYPNPTSDQSTLQFDNEKKEICTLTLYNNIGQIVRTINNITSDQVVIQKNNLTNGLYYFVLRTGDRVIVTGKLAVD